LPSQSARPDAAQTVVVSHAPSLQKGVRPVGAEQTLPHAPQWTTAVRTSVSQPSAGLPLQSRKPSAHAPTTQRPPAQALVALASAQRAPQEPQLFGSVAVPTSQPLASTPSQSSKPERQDTRRQTPLMHAVFALGMRAAQRLSQAPQWPTSVATVTHAPPHTVCPIGQRTVQRVAPPSAPPRVQT
jgi:hypothetical protein